MNETPDRGLTSGSGMSSGASGKSVPGYEIAALREALGLAEHDQNTEHPIRVVIDEATTLKASLDKTLHDRAGVDRFVDTLRGYARRIADSGARGTITYTAREVLTTGVAEGWAEAETDPTRIDWAERQRRALIPFAVVDGRPVRPGLERSIQQGRCQLGLWGENPMADAIVTAEHEGTRYLLMIRRGDGEGWAIPGGKVDPGERPEAAARRELAEETGLRLKAEAWTYLRARLVPDPRGSDEAWAVTVPGRVDLGPMRQLPPVQGADDAKEARWIPADDYETLTRHLEQYNAGGVFAAHTEMLHQLLDPAERCPDCQVVPGQVHEVGCDVARCTLCGWQRLSCEHRDSLDDGEYYSDKAWSTWTGRWPGDLECEEFGWWVQDRCAEGLRFVACSPDAPGARADLNRLRYEEIRGVIRWSAHDQRYVMNDPQTPEDR